MHTFKATAEDFYRPINASFEDSIHMPQNYNNRDRRRSSRPQHIRIPQTSGFGAEVADSRSANSQHIVPTPSWDDASDAVPEIAMPPRWHRPADTLDERVNAPSASVARSKRGSNS
jgi:hypothetical protein